MASDPHLGHPPGKDGAPDLSQLDEVLGDVALEGEIARTPRAVIYRARVGSPVPDEPRVEPREVALKVARVPGGAEELARFAHEVRLLSEVRHPHVVEVYDWGVLPGGFPFLTLELLTAGGTTGRGPRTDAAPRDLGERLRAAVEERGWDAFYDAALQLTAGLAHIHRHGLVHLDLKPDNLGLADPVSGPPDGSGARNGLHLKILDFGLARSLADPLAAEGRGDERPEDRAIRGTLAYMAPEVLLQEGWDARADLYSLGWTLLELATGERPGRGDALAAVRLHLQGERVEPLELRSDLPEPLARILRRLIERDPARRPASAGHLLAELGEAAGRSVDLGELSLGGAELLSSRLVGREDALERLRDALRAAGQGRGRLVLLEGAEGMGKSRLLRELRRLAMLEGARVSPVRTPDAPAEPLRFLTRAFRGLGVPDPELRDPAPTETVPVEVSPAESPPDGSPPDGSPVPTERPAWRWARETAERLRASGAAGEPGTPHVLLLDDLHRADTVTHEALALLAAELPSLPVLVAAARQPPDEAGNEPTSGPRDRLGEAEGVARLPVLPLSPDEVGELAAAALGLEELPETSIAWLHRHSGGSPRRAQELLRHLATEGALVWEDGSWQVRTAELARVAPPPGDAPELSWRRLVRLEEAPRRVLEALAAIGEPATLEQLAALQEEEPERVWEALVALRLRSDLEERIDESGAVWAFAQRRLGELVYAGLETEERRRLHRRFARFLERRPDPPSRVLAEHLWRAGEREAALPWLRTAAEAAESAHGHDEAAELWARVAEAARETGEGATAREALAAEARALTAAGRYPAALRLYREILRDTPPQEAQEAGGAAAAAFLAGVWLRKGRLHARLGEHRESLESYRAGLRRLHGPGGEVDAVGEGVPAGGDSPTDRTGLRIRLLHGEATARRDLGEPDEAFATARAALRLAVRLPRQRARLLSFLAGLVYGRGDWRLAERLLRRALWVAESQADDLAQALRVRNNLANVLWKTGAWERAEEIHRENLDLCEQRRDLWGRLSALHNLGILQASRGLWREARESFAAALVMKRRLGAWETEVLTRLNLAEAEEVLGEWVAAKRHCLRGLELLAGQTDPVDRFELLARLASLERKRGDAEAAESYAREALDGAGRLGDPDLAGRCWRLLGCLEKDRRRLDRAAAYFDKSREALEDDGSPEARVRLSLSLADLELERDPADDGDGRLTEAEGHLARAREGLEELGDRLAEGELWALEAELAARRGDSETAEAGFRRSAERLEELGARFELGSTLYRWGLHSDDGDLARERLERSTATFQRLGAEAEARRARGALESLREVPRPSSTPVVLTEMMKVVNSTLDLDEVLDRIMDRALERLGAERGLIVLSDPLTRELIPAVSRNLERGEGEERNLSESVVRRVIESGEPVMTVDALEDYRFAAVDSIVTHQIRSILCVPLTIRSRRAGAIYVDHGTSRHLFGERERDFLLAFADQAAIAIDNARLYGELEEARHRLERENESLRREVMESHHLGRFIGKSPAIVELKKMLERVAVSGATVLLRGESGTGKGLVGRILHAISPRREAPFIHFNCAALPETLAESELFGYEKGAFTGAAGRKPGRFELAQGGTIFLDEIGKISRSIQAKLLRVVEEKVFERVGGTKTLEADVRILAATNLNLEEAISSGEFREDLYYRLNIIPLVLPPLRERREDLPYLVQHFLDRISRDLGRTAPEMDPAVLELFHGHRWPGNVRELEAAIHRALVLNTGDRLTPDDFAWLGLPAGQVPGPATFGPGTIPDDLGDGAYQEALDRYDRRLLAAALEQCEGKLRETSRVLGISRNTLKAKISRYGMR